MWSSVRGQEVCFQDAGQDEEISMSEPQLCLFECRKREVEINVGRV